MGNLRIFLLPKEAFFCPSLRSENACVGGHGHGHTHTIYNLKTNLFIEL